MKNSESPALQPYLLTTATPISVGTACSPTSHGASYAGAAGQSSRADNEMELEGGMINVIDRAVR